MTADTGTKIGDDDGMRPPAYLILDTEIFYQFCDKSDQGRLEQNAAVSKASSF